MCPGVGERCLCRQQIQHRADAGPVTTLSHLGGLLRAGDQILSGSDSPGRGLERVIRAEYLIHDLLPQQVGPGGIGIGLGRGLTFIVQPGEPGEERNAEAE